VPVKLPRQEKSCLGAPCFNSGIPAICWYMTLLWNKYEYRALTMHDASLSPHAQQASHGWSSVASAQAAHRAFRLVTSDVPIKTQESAPTSLWFASSSPTPSAHDGTMLRACACTRTGFANRRLTVRPDFKPSHRSKQFTSVKMSAVAAAGTVETIANDNHHALRMLKFINYAWTPYHAVGA
jgi:hypothetical protein